MKIDDLMEVWRSQDAAPLHDVNETLLRLALREDQAKVQAMRRLESRIIYVVGAGLIAGMAIFFVMIFGMLFYNDDDAIVGWDLAIPIVGAAAGLYMSVHMYMTRRAQAQREQRFGDSLRDQLGRRIAQLDYLTTTAVWREGALVTVTFIGATAVVLAGIRVNMEPNEPFDWSGILGVILFLALTAVFLFWARRRETVRYLLPRKRRLEGLLKELDG